MHNRVHRFSKALKSIEAKLRIRKFDDLLVLLAVFFFIFGCIIIPEPPIPVELTTFADLSNTTSLQFDAGGEQESFELNISRYTTVGNSSELNKGAGVIESFSMQICPTEHLGSNASNLTLYWPSGGTLLFYPGTLTSCENVSIDPEDFNDYLQVHQSPSVANFASNIFGGGGFYTEWGISMKNPKMKDVNDPVTYQLMILEPAVPEDLMTQLIALIGETLPPGFDLIEGARLSGLRYTCYEWDGVRETTTPSAIYPIMLSVPGLNISSMLPGWVIPNGTIIMNATVFDMDCPPYGTPGKYRADVRKMQLDLDNYTGSVPSDSFADDFDAPVLNPAWHFRGVNSSYNYQPALSKIDLISPDTPGDPSANLLYYNDSFNAPTSNESGTYVVANIFFNESAPDAGVGLLFVNETIEPTTMGASIPYFRGGIIYNNENLTVFCPNMSPDFSENLTEFSQALGWPPVTGWHELAYYSTGNLTVFLYDAMPISINCNPQNESVYAALTSDPLTDSMSGNTSVGWFEVYNVEYKENYTGSAWFDLGLLSYAEFLNQTIYSDVIVFDADSEGDKYGRTFEFEVESDTPGIVEVSNVNLTYGSLISYGDAGSYPTSTLDDDSNFSWFMINSHLINSDMVLNSYAYNSTITNSEIVMSRVDCTNVTNSTLVFSGAVYNPRDPIKLPIPTPIDALNITDCSGEIVDSNLEFVFLIGGNAWNSNLSTLPAMIATDFRDAEFSNLTLKSGQMIVNGTRAPDIFNGPVELSELFGAAIEGLTNQSDLPFGCEEDSEMVLDSATDLRLEDSTAAVMNCRFNLYNSNFTIQNSTFDNSFGGIRVSLHNSTLRVGDIPELVNITTYGHLTDVVFWNLNTSLLPGELVLSSEDVYVEAGMASLNGNSTRINFTELTTIVNTTLIFNYVGSWDGNITYYENYTSNMSEALEKGIECPPDRCYNIVHDTVAHTLRVDVANFSTYVVNYTPTPPTPPTPPDPPPTSPGDGSDLDFEVSVQGECVGQEIIFSAVDSSGPMQGASILIRGPGAEQDSTRINTDQDGEAVFIPEEEGTYYYAASEGGYNDVEGSFSAVACEEPILLPDVPIVDEIPPELPDEHEGECGTYVGSMWTPYSCCSDSDCGVGEQCVVNTCIPAAVSVIEIDEAGHTEIEIPSVEVPEVAPSEEVSASSCCLIGICMDFAGICWYYWMAGIVLLVIAAGAYFYYASSRKPSKKK